MKSLKFVFMAFVPFGIPIVFGFYVLRLCWRRAVAARALADLRQEPPRPPVAAS